ncbi:hypothetical protein Tco_0330766 [Tanacetum coccineum]
MPVPLDHFPIHALTYKVFSFMFKKGKHFSGKVTPLFPTMLVPPIVDEGESLERPSEPQPTPSPPHPSEAKLNHRLAHHLDLHPFLIPFQRVLVGIKEVSHPVINLYQGVRVA